MPLPTLLADTLIQNGYNIAHSRNIHIVKSDQWIFFSPYPLDHSLVTILSCRLKVYRTFTVWIPANRGDHLGAWEAKCLTGQIISENLMHQSIQKGGQE